MEFSINLGASEEGSVQGVECGFVFFAIELCTRVISLYKKEFADVYYMYPDSWGLNLNCAKNVADY